jgi:hypothetical protein
MLASVAVRAAGTITLAAGLWLRRRVRRLRRVGQVMVARPAAAR